MLSAPVIVTSAPAAHPDVAALLSFHAELLDLLQLLERETARPVPDMATVGTIRRRLTQTSRRKAALLDELMPTLSGSAACELRDQVRAARLKSSAHIGLWSQAAVAADWRGYCAASAAMRAAMRLQITREARAFRG
jgi:hypothetical protein